jgi:hypothetical protein
MTTSNTFEGQFSLSFAVATSSPTEAAAAAAAADDDEAATLHHANARRDSMLADCHCSST